MSEYQEQSREVRIAVVASGRTLELLEEMQKITGKSKEILLERALESYISEYRYSQSEIPF